jgi:hypothetical protein
MTTISSAFAEEVSGIAIPKAASAAKAMASLRIVSPPTQQIAGYQERAQAKSVPFFKITIQNACSFKIKPDAKSAILVHVSLWHGGSRYC